MKRDRSAATIGVFPAVRQEKKLFTRVYDRSVRLFKEKLAEKGQALMTNMAVTILTTLIFLGGFYLFFVQLAEHGW